MLFSEPKIPQCPTLTPRQAAASCFSALQRAENSSMICGALHGKREDEVSVLFSEPKIPQFGDCNKHSRLLTRTVSVLFSEPKIPQFCVRVFYINYRLRVSVLFSEPKIPQCECGTSRPSVITVSVLFSEPKIPQCQRSTAGTRIAAVSVLFSEPKIPQWCATGG